MHISEAKRWPAKRWDAAVRAKIHRQTWFQWVLQPGMPYPGDARRMTMTPCFLLPLLKPKKDNIPASLEPDDRDP